MIKDEVYGGGGQFRCGSTMLDSSVRWVLVMLAVSLARSSPVGYHEVESRSLDGAGVVSELGQRLVSHSSLLEKRADPRLPLPTPQDIEAIKKVAQILIMLGEQHSERNEAQETLNGILDTLRTLKPKSRKQKYVIPAIVGDGGTPHSKPPPVLEEIPNDPVEA